MNKVLFQTKLTDVDTADLDGIGRLREEDEKAYRWVKNSSGTALIAAGCALMDFTETAADIFKRVRCTDVPSTGPSTCLVTMPAGSPVTAIGASGASTACHGWIQVAGIKRVDVRQSATAAQQEAGCYVIATGIAVTLDNWGKPYTSIISSSGGGVQLRCAQLVASLASTGVATVASAIVQLRCL